MQAYPHHYKTRASSSPGNLVKVDSAGLDPINTAPPAEFGGPGDKWSPETLLAAAIADCYILTFQAISRASKLDWVSLECEVEAVLDRVENVTRFTHFNIKAALRVPAGCDESKAQHILEKSEAVCLVTNSLTGTKSLEISIEEES
jgi:organic hydroperoxide reductase OsmC/OhrA